MNQNTHKNCRNPQCNKLFPLFRTTDKYCSWACMKNHDKPKPIAHASPKLKSELTLYGKEKKEFLNLMSVHPCPVMLKIKGKRFKITDLHHMAGRKGKLLRYKPYWLAVSREGHNWIHDNPEKAYELGFLIRSTTVNI